MILHNVPLAPLFRWRFYRTGRQLISSISSLDQDAALLSHEYAMECVFSLAWLSHGRLKTEISTLEALCCLVTSLPASIGHWFNCASLSLFQSKEIEVWLKYTLSWMTVRSGHAVKYTMNFRSEIKHKLKKLSHWLQQYYYFIHGADN